MATVRAQNQYAWRALGWAAERRVPAAFCVALCAALCAALCVSLLGLIAYGTYAYARQGEDHRLYAR